MYDPVKAFLKDVERSGLRDELFKREFARSRSELRRFKDHVAAARRWAMEKKIKKRKGNHGSRD
jgi:hypothetical protein